MPSIVKPLNGNMRKYMDVVERTTTNDTENMSHENAFKIEIKMLKCT